MKCRKVSHLVNEFPKFQFPAPPQKFWANCQTPPEFRLVLLSTPRNILPLYYFVKCIFITGNVKQQCWGEMSGAATKGSPREMRPKWQRWQQMPYEVASFWSMRLVLIGGIAVMPWRILAGNYFNWFSRDTLLLQSKWDFWLWQNKKIVSKWDIFWNLGASFNYTF